MDVHETYIVYLGEFHGVLTGINYAQGRLADASRPVQMTSQAATQLWAGPPDLAGRPADREISRSSRRPLRLWSQTSLYGSSAPTGSHLTQTLAIGLFTLPSRIGRSLARPAISPSYLKYPVLNRGGQIPGSSRSRVSWFTGKGVWQAQGYGKPSQTENALI